MAFGVANMCIPIKVCLLSAWERKGLRFIAKEEV